MVAQISWAVSVGSAFGDDPGPHAALDGGHEVFVGAGALAEGVVGRLEARDGPEEHQLVGHRVGEGEGPVAVGTLEQRLGWIRDLRHGLHGGTEAFEALDVERFDDPGLRLEVVVDAHRGDAGGGGDAAHREAVGALGLEDVSGRGEERPLHPGTGGPASWSRCRVFVMGLAY